MFRRFFGAIVEQCHEAGLVWGEEAGQILLHPDEAVRGAISAVFERFAATGSARQVWLWRGGCRSTQCGCLGQQRPCSMPWA